MFFKRPLFYGILYIGNIAVFAFVYRFIFPFSFKACNLTSLDFISSLYFSTITATTLGFGDIVPKLEDIGLLITIVSQVIAAVVIIGLFLNSLSILIQEKKEAKINKEQEEKHIMETKKMMVILKPIIDNHLETLSFCYKLTASESKPEEYQIRPSELFNNKYYDQVCMIDYFSKNKKYPHHKFLANELIEEFTTFQKELESFLTKFAFRLDVDTVKMINDIQKHSFFEYPTQALQMYYHFKSIGQEMPHKHLISLEHSSRVDERKDFPTSMRNYHNPSLSIQWIFEANLEKFRGLHPFSSLALLNF